MAFQFKGSQAKGGKGFKMGGGVVDPLADVQYTGDLQADTDAEFEALKQGYRARASAEADRFRNATDSEYWFAVCFKSREDKEKFLAAVKAKPRLHGDKYLDGYQLAKLLGVDL